RPETVPFVFLASDGGEQLSGAPSAQSGEQGFQGLRPYRQGDSMRRIAWKQLARGKGLVSKDFDHDEGATCWLDWAALTGVPTETRLSRLCGWVLQAHQQGWRYGLRLPGEEFSPDNSEGHRDRCLRALALYGFSAPEGLLVSVPGRQWMFRFRVPRCCGCWAASYCRCGCTPRICPCGSGRWWLLCLAGAG